MTTIWQISNDENEDS